jgi:release factor glutamine methyltransferase
MTKTVKELVEIFESQHISDPPQLDAQLIIAHILEKPRTWIASHGELSLTNSQIDSAQKEFSRLKTGTPLPYILGHWEFFGLDFEVTKDVLIPRPETELLVEKAIVWLQNSPDKRMVLDIGTGSGAIAVSIAVNIPDSKLLATDISPLALEVAKRNAKKFNVEKQIDFNECDLLPASNLQHPTFNLICANLPYVPTETMLQLPIYGREPTIALDGGSDGLVLYGRLFKLIPDWLAPQSKMLFEIEASLGLQSLSLAREYFPQAEIHLHQDLTGRDRLLDISLP